MSDSEYYNAKRSAKAVKKKVAEEFSDSDAERTTWSNVKTTSNNRVYGTKRAKKNFTADHQEQSDEEVASKKSKQVSKTSALKNKKAPKKNLKSSGWFESEDEDEEVQQRSTKKQLVSALTRRVADGVLRRTATLAGDVFIELKIYNTADILSVEPKNRWEHAVVSVKYQTSSDADEVGILKDFVRRIKPSFKEEGTFFSNKNLIK